MGVRPWAGRSPLCTLIIALAPSFSVDELPAVTVPPSRKADGACPVAPDWCPHVALRLARQRRSPSAFGCGHRHDLGIKRTPGLSRRAPSRGSRGRRRLDRRERCPSDRRCSRPYTPWPRAETSPPSWDSGTATPSRCPRGLHSPPWGVGSARHRVGRSGHPLHAACDEDVAVTAACSTEGLVDRLEAGGTEPIDRHTRHGLGNPGEQGSHPCDVAVVFSRLVRAAHEHVVDVDRIQAGLFDHGRDGPGQQVIGRTVLQPPMKRPIAVRRGVQITTSRMALSSISRRRVQGRGCPDHRCCRGRRWPPLQPP